MKIAHSREFRISRFWSRIIKPDDSSCWEWSGSVDALGYGICYWETKPENKRRCVAIRAHRLVWELTNGPIQNKDLCVCHHCDNPPCCNPSHLFLGTRADNNADKMAKGRNADNRGVKNPRAKLNEDSVREIRVGLSSGNSQSELARKFGVRQAQIWRIKEGVPWSSVT